VALIFFVRLRDLRAFVVSVLAIDRGDAGGERVVTSR